MPLHGVAQGSLWLGGRAHLPLVTFDASVALDLERVYLAVAGIFYGDPFTWQEFLEGWEALFADGVFVVQIQTGDVYPRPPVLGAGGRGRAPLRGPAARLFLDHRRRTTSTGGRVIQDHAFSGRDPSQRSCAPAWLLSSGAARTAPPRRAVPARSYRGTARRGADGSRLDRARSAAVSRATVATAVVFLCATDNLSGPLSPDLNGRNRPFSRPQNGSPTRHANCLCGVCADRYYATPRSPNDATSQAIWDCGHGGTR